MGQETCAWDIAAQWSNCTHRKEKQPRDLSDAGQKSTELTTPPEPPNSARLLWPKL